MSNLKLSLLSYNIVEYYVINISKYAKGISVLSGFLELELWWIDVVYGIIKIGV